MRRPQGGPVGRSAPSRIALRGRAARPPRGPAGFDSDERLVDLAQQGDDEAFEAIVERYRAMLLGHCRPLARGDAEDAVQQAFLSAWSDLRQGKEVRVLRPWLFTIAHRAALRTMRRAGERCDQLSDSVGAARSAAEEAEQTARARMTLASIADLPTAEREALLSTAVHGNSGRVAARALGVSEDTVRHLVYRARGKVKAAGALAIFPPAWVWRVLGPGRLQKRALHGAGAGARATLARIAAVAAAGALVAAPVAILRVAHPRAASSAATPTTALATKRAAVAAAARATSARDAGLGVSRTGSDARGAPLRAATSSSTVQAAVSPSPRAAVVSPPSTPDADTGRSATRIVSLVGAGRETLVAAGSLRTGGLPAEAQGSISRLVGAVSAELAPAAIAAPPLAAAAAQQAAPNATQPATPAVALAAGAQSPATTSTPPLPAP